jgi:CBS domain-containing protein
MHANGATEVAGVMSRHPIVVAPSAKVADAMTRMRTCRIRHLPVVVADDRLVGVISLRDLLATPTGIDVGAIMSAPIATSPAECVRDAASTLLTRRISCLPVLTREKLVGIFSATDALRYAVATLDEDVRALRDPLSVEQMMTPRPLVTTSPGATLDAAWRAMKAARVRHLPVLDGEELVGILSDRDLLAAGGPSAGASVASKMTAPALTAAADDRASDAANLLLRRRVGALPVLRGRSLVGVLAVTDFLHWIAAQA